MTQSPTTGRRAALSRLNGPWMHYLGLGLLLHLLRVGLAPPEKPVVGPVDESRLQSLRMDFHRSAGHPPSLAEQEQLIARELDREMLFGEAVALELHLDDPVVRQRLVRNMRFLGLAGSRSSDELFLDALEMGLHLEDRRVRERLIQRMKERLLEANAPDPVTEQQLREEFEARRKELAEAPVLGLIHVFLAPAQQGRSDDVEALIDGRRLSSAQARRLSSPFPFGHRFVGMPTDQLASLFGEAFMEGLLATSMQPATWHGPIRSKYGEHYVWLESVEPSRVRTFDDVRDSLERDLQLRAQHDALESSLKLLRQDFDVRM